MLATCLVVLATPLVQMPVRADTISALQAKRVGLQQQAAALGPQRAAALQALADAEQVLQNLQAELNHNAAYLADLQHQLDALRAQIDATNAQIAHQHALLDEMTRGQYKTMSSDDQLALIFGSKSFGDLMNNVMAAATINRRIADTARKLKAEEADLASQSQQLADKQAAAQQVQAQLSMENAKELALVADHDAALARLDAQQRALLGAIAGVNKQIQAAQAPVFTSGGSGPCGNHFSYGYCTWYVANRRCIPWYGNADEWWANARAYGYPEGQQAQRGAVAVWAAGPGTGSVGHVAYVESVDSGGFTVSEYNYTYGWNRYDTRYVSYSNPGPLDGFIYGK